MDIDTATYTVTGKRGPGAMRVEWEFAPIEQASCARTVRIYGSVQGADPLVTRPLEIVMQPASIAAVACMDASSDRRTVTRT